MRSAHDFRHIEQVIEVGMGHENCVDIRTDMSQTVAHPVWIRFDPLVQRTSPESNPGEVGIDQQNVAAVLELKSVNSEISDADRIRQR